MDKKLNNLEDEVHDSMMPTQVRLYDLGCQFLCSVKDTSYTWCWKHTPLVHFAWLLYNQTIFQKFERSFFDQVAIDSKNVQTFERHPLVAELKLKVSQIALFFMFSISALPPEGAFHMFTHF